MSRQRRKLSVVFTALSSLAITVLVQVPAHAQELIWARAMGGPDEDRSLGVAVDGAGNVYTTGSFSGTADFNPGVATSNLTSAGSADVFVSKLDSSGNFVWARAMGGPGSDIGLDIAVDGAGNVHTTGIFAGTGDFDPGGAISNLTSAAFEDVFVSKLDSSGNFVWARAMGGPSVEEGLGIAVDGAGNVHTTGFFQGTADFDPGAPVSNLTSAGDDDVFVSKLDSSGNFVWARAMGGPSDDQGSGIAVDGAGNVHTTGRFDGTADFDPSGATSNLIAAGTFDVFVSKLDSLGNFVWARAMGGPSFEQGSGIALDGAGNVHTTGPFQGTADFDPGGATSNLTAGASGDVFVSKLDSSGNFVWARAMGGPGEDTGLGIAVDGAGNVHTTGFFVGTADFDPGGATSNLTAAGSLDVFVSKLDSSGNFVWARAMGGPDSDLGLGIAVDGAGNVLTTGFFQGTADFDPGPGVFNLTSAGSNDVFVSKLGPAPKLTIIKQCTDTAFPGTQITCTITVNNTGGTATNVVVTDTLPAQLSFVPGSISATNGFTCAVAGKTLTCSKATVPVASPATVITFKATLASNLQPGASVSNTAKVTAGNSASQPSDTEVVKVPGCTISGSGAIQGTPGNDVICGSAANDSIHGLGGDDKIFGQGGADNIQGDTGNDLIFGGDGNDNLQGADGNDKIFGGNGNDIMSGGNGNDSLVGEAGTDTANGGAGTDSCSAETLAACP